MEASAVQPGMHVVIAAADDFYAYIDGWECVVAGWESGYVVVHHLSAEGNQLQFLVPPAQLKEIKGRESSWWQFWTK